MAKINLLAWIIIAGCILLMPRSVFPLDNQIEKELQNIKTRMELNPIPFQSTLRIENFKLFWYLHLPTTHMSDLLFYLRPKLVEFHLNYIDHPRTKTYLLNTEAWDEKKQTWKIDEDYCINQVLGSLKSDKIIN